MKQLDLGPTGKTVAQNLHRLRSGLNLTYSALSRILEANGHKIPELGLRRIEAQARRVDSDDLVALAVALNVSPLTLLLPEYATARTAASVTGFPEERGTNVLWLWGLGEEPLTLTQYPGASDQQINQSDIALFQAVAKPHVEPRAKYGAVPVAHFVVGDANQQAEDSASALSEATRLSEAQGIRRRG